MGLKRRIWQGVIVAHINRLYYGDNLEVLRNNIADESVDLVYLDPSFNSNRNYNVIFGKHVTVNSDDAAQIQAFGDTWTWTPETDEQYGELISGAVPNQVANAVMAMRTLLTENDAMAYLVNMAPRLVELHRVLKPTGSLYLHCDSTMSHYLKVLLDAIFGVPNFRDEIIWQRHNARSVKQALGSSAERTRFVVWASSEYLRVRTFRCRLGSCVLGFPPTWTVLTIWTGCAGRTDSSARGAATREGGLSPIAGTNA